MARLGSSDGTRGRSRRGIPAELSLWPDPELREARWPGDRRPGSAFLLGARVRLHCYSLDRKLALGGDPCASPKLARRAHELCQPALRGRLAADLEDVVYAQGVARVRLLLVDGCSPIYAPSDPRWLETELRRARTALVVG
jgi:hypothetical protein